MTTGITKLSRRPLLVTAFAMAGLGASAIAPGAWAQGEWPTKPVRFIVPLPPGGPSDIVLRSALDKMQPVLKQPLVLENKPGANGNLGTGEVARAAPDGYTWLWTTDTTMTVNPSVYRSLGFKVDDLVPVIRAGTLSQTLVCYPGLGLRSVADFLARAKGGKMTYATGGAGSPGHLTTELFSSTAGITMAHVPYKGPAPAMQDVIGGQVDCGFLAGPTVLPHVRAGKLTALAVSGAKRSPLLPDVPTLAESGFPGFEAVFSLLLFAPRGTPQPIIDKMYSTMAAGLRQPDVVEKLRANDLEVIAAPPAQAAARLAADAKTWGAVVKRIGLKQD
jgi:tripartite-type tricarboxylate transporter receptor subunit TctC